MESCVDSFQEVYLTPAVQVELSGGQLQTQVVALYDELQDVLHLLDDHLALAERHVRQTGQFGAQTGAQQRHLNRIHK